MNTEIKAIETKYRGYRFRSRMEAKWALFFDLCGIKWEYEPEGYQFTGGVRYLPDFFLTFGNGKSVWAEVKRPGGDLSKPFQFCKDTHNSILILEGNPELSRYYVFHSRSDVEMEESSPEDFMVNGPTEFFAPMVWSNRLFVTVASDPIDPWWDSDIPFARRAYSQMFLYDHENESEFPLSIGEGYGPVGMIEDGYKKIEEAVNKAHAARFEFGERPL